MSVGFIVSHWNSINKLLHQYLLLCTLCIRWGEVNIFSALEHLSEFVEISHLESKVDLLSQSLFQRCLTDWDLHGWRDKRCQVTHEEKQVYISFNMFIHIRVSNLHGYFFTFVFGTINLTYWSRSYGNRIKLFKNVFYLAAIWFLEVLFCGLKGMGWSIFSQVFELVCHIWTYNISPVTEILKSFDKDHSRALDSLHKELKPIILCFFKEKKRREYNGRCENHQQLKEPESMYDTWPDIAPNCGFRLLNCWIWYFVD